MTMTADTACVANIAGLIRRSINHSLAIGLFDGWTKEGDSFLIYWFCIILFILAAGAVLISRLFLKGKIKLPGIAFITMLFLGTVYNFVLCPLSAPDEVQHYVNVYEMSNMILHSPSPLRDDENRVRIREEDVFLDDWPEDGDPDNATVTGMHLCRDTYRELNRRGIFSTGEDGWHYTLQEPIKTMPLAHLLPALGFCIARILHLGGFGMVFLGRTMNLLYFSFMLWLSMRKTPVGKEVFFGVSLFPMLLELAASLSYDVYLLGLCFYLTAFVLDLSLSNLSNKSIGKKDILEMSLLAVLLSPCKMVYAISFLSCLAIPKIRWKKRSHYYLSMLLIICLVIASILLINYQEFFRYANLSQETSNGVELQDNGPLLETYSFYMFKQNPGLLAGLIANTISVKGGEYLITMAGKALGHLDWDLGLSMPLVWYFYISVLLLTLLGRKENHTLNNFTTNNFTTNNFTLNNFTPNNFALNKFQRILFALTPVLLLIILIISMLTAYTPKDSEYALGVQGRYLLPLFPMFLIAFRKGTSNNLSTSSLTSILLLLEIVMNGYVLMKLFLIAALR